VPGWKCNQEELFNYPQQTLLDCGNKENANISKTANIMLGAEARQGWLTLAQIQATVLLMKISEIEALACQWS
jgi:hypothetical protein